MKTNRKTIKASDLIYKLESEIAECIHNWMENERLSDPVRSAVWVNRMLAYKEVLKTVQRMVSRN